MTKTYNGHANRDTWLVSLHFGDMLQEELQDMVDYGAIEKYTPTYVLVDIVEESIQVYLEPILESANSFVRDMLNLSGVDFHSLVEGYMDELIFPEEEEEEEED